MRKTIERIYCSIEKNSKNKAKIILRTQKTKSMKKKPTQMERKSEKGQVFEQKQTTANKGGKNVIEDVFF